MTMIIYKQFKSLPEDYIKEKIREFLSEDIPSFDLTTKPFINSNQPVKAYLQAEEDMVFSGADVIPCFFEDSNSVKLMVADSGFVPNGGIIAELTAPAHLILTIERTLLNLLQRLCGIATLTSKYAEIAKPYNVRILDTRKTMPGLRLFEKYAVTCGGGYNHRLNLSAGILIKDNHIKAAGSVKKAVLQIKQMKYGLPVEIEVENFEELKEAISAGADGFLLDNMAPEIVSKCVGIIRSTPSGDSLFIEASGGINLTNLAEYVKTGVDAISTGALTHSVKSSNIHLEFGNA